MPIPLDLRGSEGSGRRKLSSRRIQLSSAILSSRNFRAAVNCSRWRGCVAASSSRTIRVRESRSPSSSLCRLDCSGVCPLGAVSGLFCSADSTCSSTALLSHPRATLLFCHNSPRCGEFLLRYSAEARRTVPLVYAPAAFPRPAGARLCRSCVCCWKSDGGARRTLLRADRATRARCSAKKPR